MTVGNIANGDYLAFEAWTTQALANSPDTPAAFCFNLYEYEDAYAIQLVASAQFEASDPDWAVDPIFFTPNGYLFLLPKGLNEDDWQLALAKAIELVERYLSEGRRALVLRESRAVACGFVEGDLHVLWSVP